MKTRLFASVLVSITALVFLAGCAAFDTSSKPYENAPNDYIYLPGTGGQFEGKYAGDMTLIENECANLSGDIDSTIPVTVNVVQSAQLVSFAFDDGSEVTGTLIGSKVSTIKKNPAEAYVYYFEFTDKGISGTCEYIETSPGADQLGNYCAKYTLELTKE